jgi:hypothetical protein
LRRRFLDRVEPLQLREAELQGQRPELVAPRAVLHHEADLQEADEVGMRLADRHAGRLSQIAQRHRRDVPPEGDKQLRSDLD